MLTQLSTIKTRLGISDNDVKDDAILTAALQGVSDRFENETNRLLGRAVGATEEFEGDETELRLAIYPIESITQFELKTNETDGWVLQTAAQVEYVIRKNCVLSLVARLGTWQQVLRVTYTGGYVLPGTTPSAGQTALPDDLEQAAVEQVAYWYQSRNRLGLVSVSGEGGSVTQYSQLDLLPSVKNVLHKYERWMA